MTFTEAIEAMKSGKMVTRRGSWADGRSMWLHRDFAGAPVFMSPIPLAPGQKTWPIDCWDCAEDILANDWEVVE